jgi:hypothetical protein
LFFIRGIGPWDDRSNKSSVSASSAGGVAVVSIWELVRDSARLEKAADVLKGPLVVKTV